MDSTITIEGHHQEKETHSMTQTMQTADHAPVAEKEKEVKIVTLISDHTAINRLKMKVVNITKININITKIVTVVVMGEGRISTIMVTTTSEETTIVVVTNTRGNSITINSKVDLATI